MQRGPGDLNACVRKAGRVEIHEPSIQPDMLEKEEQNKSKKWIRELIKVAAEINCYK